MLVPNILVWLTELTWRRCPANCMSRYATPTARVTVPNMAVAAYNFNVCRTLVFRSQKKIWGDLTKHSVGTFQHLFTLGFQPGRTWNSPIVLRHCASTIQPRYGRACCWDPHSLLGWESPILPPLHSKSKRTFTTDPWTVQHKWRIKGFFWIFL